MENMEIYKNNPVYGISWSIFDNQNNVIKMFEKKYNKEMTIKNIKEIKQYYDKIVVDEKQFILYYLFCLDTEGDDSLMAWYEIKKSDLDKWFFEKNKIVKCKTL